MREVLIVGAGHIGAAAASMLASTGDYRVTVADRSPERLAELSAGVEPFQLEAENPRDLQSAMVGKFATLSAAPYRLTANVAQAAKAAAIHYLDLTEDVI